MIQRISIIGNGTVGQAVGKVLVSCGYDVTFYDIDGERLMLLASQGYKVVQDLQEAILSTALSFMCVPGPTVGNTFDPSYIKAACFEIAQALEPKKSYHLIAVKSTVLPGVVEAVKEEAEREFGRRNWGFCLNPEFLRSESPEEDFRTPRFILIGGLDKEASRRLKAFYEGFRDKVEGCFEIVTADPKAVALIKYASNCLLATKVSFYNEIDNVCRILDVDTKLVMRYTLTDSMATPEWYKRDFLLFGFQDECLPKDLDAFITFSKNLNSRKRLDLLEATRIVNRRKSAYKKDCQGKHKKWT